jgi:hypothetical protein
MAYLAAIWVTKPSANKLLQVCYTFLEMEPLILSSGKNALPTTNAVDGSK